MSKFKSEKHACIAADIVDAFLGRYFQTRRGIHSYTKNEREHVCTVYKLKTKMNEQIEKNMDSDSSKKRKRTVPGQEAKKAKKTKKAKKAKEVKKNSKKKSKKKKSGKTKVPPKVVPKKKKSGKTKVPPKVVPAASASSSSSSAAAAASSLQWDGPVPKEIEKIEHVHEFKEVQTAVQRARVANLFVKFKGKQQNLFSLFFFHVLVLFPVLIHFEFKIYKYFANFLFCFQLSFSLSQKEKKKFIVMAGVFVLNKKK